MIFAGLFVTALLGWLTLPRNLAAGPVAGLSLGFAWAAFGFSLAMFAADLAGLPWNAWLLALLWAAAAAALRWRRRPHPSVEWNAGVAIALGGALAAIALWLPLERAMPLTSQSWDAWAIWLFKAKAFFIDGTIATYLDRAAEFQGQPGYPLLLPLYVTFLYELNGAAADQAAKFVSPCFFMALLGGFYYLSRRMASPLAAGVLTAALALAPMAQRVAFGLAGYADTALSLYLLAAGGFLFLWLRDGGTVDLAAGSLAATAGAWTKNEGQLFLAGFAVVAAVRIWRQRRPKTEFAWLALPPAIVLGLWTIVRTHHGIEAAGFALLADFDPNLFRIALRSLASKAFAPSSFGLVFPLFLVAAAGGAAWRAPRAFWAVPALVAWHLLGALLAYSTGRNDIHWWLETSADRVVTQIVPLALLAAVAAAGLWEERTALAPAEPRPAPNPKVPRPPRSKRRRS